MKVYIVRHGQVPHNALNQYNTSDEDLTDLGIKQAEELRNKIQNIHFDIVISSPLLRATHTEYILTNYDNSIITAVDMNKENLDSDTLIIYDLIKESQILMQN